MSSRNVDDLIHDLKVILKILYKCKEINASCHDTVKAKKKLSSKQRVLLLRAFQTLPLIEKKYHDMVAILAAISITELSSSL
jgi:hypothetical protein